MEVGYTMRDKLSRGWKATEPYRTPRRVTDRATGFSKTPLVLNLIWWLWAPTVFFLWWGFINTPVIGPRGIGSVHQGLGLFVVHHITAANGGTWGMSGQFWVWLAIGFFGSVVITIFLDEDDGMSAIEGLTAVVSGLLMIVALIPASISINGSMYDRANVYLANTTVHIADPSVNGVHPSSLGLMYTAQSTTTKTANPDGSVQIGHVLVDKGTLPNDLLDIEPRTAAAAGALKALQQKTLSPNNTGVWDDTLTYVYGAPVGLPEGTADTTQTAIYPQTDRWSALIDVSDRDANNYANPLVGVSEWVGGAPRAHICAFGDANNRNNKFNRAFGGNHMNSLPNVIYTDFPRLLWEPTDISGYCDKDDHPIIMIATRCNVGAGARTIEAPCGDLKVTGSPNGNPTIEYLPNIAAGKYPVPVYPLSIVETQRQMLDFLAGRGNQDNASFGFQESDYATQADNSGDYVVRNVHDSGIYAMTPEKAKNSGKSQKYVDWNFIRVDSVNAGHFNGLDAYVLDDNDPRAVDPVSLDNSAQLVVNTANLVPNAFANGNKLREYLPIGSGRFRAFLLNNNNNTVLYVDLYADGSKPAVVTQLDPTTGQVLQQVTINITDASGTQPPPNSGGNGGQTGAGSCGNFTATSIRTATVAQLQACVASGNLAVQELIRRALAAAAASPSPSAPPAPATSRSPSPAPSSTG